jgi:predicted nucleotidyltransferase
MRVVAPPGALTDIQRTELLHILRGYAPPIERVDLYGSRARGSARLGSDIDIVLAGPVDRTVLANLAGDLEDSYLSVSVDVSAYAMLEPGPYLDQVLATARQLFDADDLRGPAR